MPRRSVSRRSPVRFSVELLERRDVFSGFGTLSVETAAMGAGADSSGTFGSVEELRVWVATEAVARFGEVFGTTQESSWNPYSWWSCACDTDGALLGDFAVTLSSASDISGVTTNSSNATNVQVEGVDEADLVETDGEYLYMVSGGELLVIDLRTPDAPALASRFELSGAVQGIYLIGDRLTVVAASRHETEWDVGIFNPRTDWWIPASPTAPPEVSVTVLDVSDRAAPVEVERTEVKGDLVSSRMVGGELRLVTSTQGHGQLPSVRSTTTRKELPADAVEPGLPSVVASTTPGLSLAVVDVFALDDFDPPYVPYNDGALWVTEYETLESYVDRVVDEWLATYRTYSAEGELVGEEHLVGPEQIEWQAEPADVAYWQASQERVSVLTFDTLDDAAGPEDTHTIEVTSNSPIVYADGDSLYVFAAEWSQKFEDDFWSYGYQTNVTKLAFDGAGGVGLSATGIIAGSLINQFAADEHGGYLRVVAQTGSWPNDQRLSVLEEVDGRLVEVGSIESLAPGETLHSVRFMGDEAYAVTFRTIDPLFAIDLSDPTAPAVRGELKVPGYSAYLHPLGEGHLIGLGWGAAESSGFLLEMQVSVFEVDDLHDPRLVQRHSIGGGRSTWSPALGDRLIDHHAVAFYEDLGVLTLPIATTYDGWWWDAAPPEPLFEPGEGGLLVLSVDGATGIEELAVIEHEDPIERSVRFGDTLVAISAGRVTTHAFDAPGVLLGSLDLEAAAAAVPLTLARGALAIKTQLAASEGPVEAPSVAPQLAGPAPRAETARTRHAASPRASFEAADEAILLLVGDSSRYDAEENVETSFGTEPIDPGASEDFESEGAQAIGKGAELGDLVVSATRVV